MSSCGSRWTSRTSLGHFRHEIGHYYYGILAASGPTRDEFEALFSDPDADYQAPWTGHCQQGPPTGWPDTYVSAYAERHAAEDWAETFAHYLHIRDTLDTAAAFGFAPAGATPTTPLAGDVGFNQIIDLWLPLAWSLNMINRAMGHPDLYPFLPPAALDKMRLVHQVITEVKSPVPDRRRSRPRVRPATAMAARPVRHGCHLRGRVLPEPQDLRRLVEHLRESLAPDGVLVACHWRHPIRGWPLDGPRVHELIQQWWPQPVRGRHLDRDVEILVLGGESTWPDPAP